MLQRGEVVIELKRVHFERKKNVFYCIKEFLLKKYRDMIQRSLCYWCKALMMPVVFSCIQCRVSEELATDPRQKRNRG